MQIRRRNKKSNMADGRHIGRFISKIISRASYDLDEIWCVVQMLILRMVTLIKILQI